MRKLSAIIITLLMFSQLCCAQRYDMPEVPDSLTEPVARADYAAARYWLRFPFADTTLLHNSYAEQAMVDFFGLMPFTSERGKAVAVQRWLSAASCCEDAFSYFLSQSERYLYRANSPLRNVNLFALVMETTSKMSVADTISMAHVRYMARLLSKNAEGSNAADLQMLTADGRTTSLYNVLADGRPLLLLLYDLECEHCRDVLFRLRYCSPLNVAIDERRLQVMAVCVGGDERQWRDGLPDMPQRWVNAIDRSGVGDNMLYDLSALPALYLIGGDCKVLMREPDLQRLIDFLLVF